MPQCGSSINFIDWKPGPNAAMRFLFSSNSVTVGNLFEKLVFELSLSLVHSQAIATIYNLQRIKILGREIGNSLLEWFVMFADLGRAIAGFSVSDISRDLVMLASFYGLENVPGLARQGPIPDSASDVVYYSEKSSFIHGGCANTVLIMSRKGRGKECEVRVLARRRPNRCRHRAPGRRWRGQRRDLRPLIRAHEDSELAAIQRILSRDEDSQERARPPGWEVLRHDGCRCSTWTETHGGWAVGVVEEELDIVSCLRGLDAVESLEQLARVDEGEFAEARGEWEQRGSGGGSGRKEEANGRRAVTISQMM
ncbi:hypothetical protein B0H17DRAFT_1154195 [Mycena rosella]|uniref:Uncharacterized protein n=1 Tax=Mycena rosella TaxID=1033263 RepID=A0AAD7F9M9_MYCRO|nr:hypothetical protein B0H17DRAFT_1154195 [Mycena rosella]